MLTIKLDKSYGLSGYETMLLQEVNIMISSHTPLSYFLSDLCDGKIKIPLHDISVDDGIGYIKKICKGPFPSRMRCLLRLFKTRKGEYPKLIVNKLLIPIEEEDAKIEVKVIKKNHDKLTIVYDPLFEETVLVSNISKPYEEMGYGWNYLHLFEHLSCADIIQDYDHFSTLNGYTSNTGCAAVFCVLKNPDEIKYALSTMLKVVNSGRSETFEQKYKDAIELEIGRTHSETLSARDFQHHGRYMDNYDINVFLYWFNQPFDGYIFTGTKRVLTQIQDLNIKPPKRTPIPTIQLLEQMPLSVLLYREVNGIESHIVNPSKVDKFLERYESPYEWALEQTIYGMKHKVVYRNTISPNVPFDFIAVVPNKYKIELLKLYPILSSQDLFNC